MACWSLQTTGRGGASRVSVGCESANQNRTTSATSECVASQSQKQQQMMSCNVIQGPGPNSGASGMRRFTHFITQQQQHEQKPEWRRSTTANIGSASMGAQCNVARATTVKRGGSKRYANGAPMSTVMSSCKQEELNTGHDKSASYQQRAVYPANREPMRRGGRGASEDGLANGVSLFATHNYRRTSGANYNKLLHLSHHLNSQKQQQHERRQSVQAPTVRPFAGGPVTAAAADTEAARGLGSNCQGQSEPVLESNQSSQRQAQRRLSFRLSHQRSRPPAPSDPQDATYHHHHHQESQRQQQERQQNQKQEQLLCQQPAAASQLVSRYQSGNSCSYKLANKRPGVKLKHEEREVTYPRSWATYNLNTHLNTTSAASFSESPDAASEWKQSHKPQQERVEWRRGSTSRTAAANHDNSAPTTTGDNYIGRSGQSKQIISIRTNAITNSITTTTTTATTTTSTTTTRSASNDRPEETNATTTSTSTSTFTTTTTIKTTCSRFIPTREAVPSVSLSLTPSSSSSPPSSSPPAPVSFAAIESDNCTRERQHRSVPLKSQPSKVTGQIVPPAVTTIVTTLQQQQQQQQQSEASSRSSVRKAAKRVNINNNRQHCGGNRTNNNRLSLSSGRQELQQQPLQQESKCVSNIDNNLKSGRHLLVTTIVPATGGKPTSSDKSKSNDINSERLRYQPHYQHQYDCVAGSPNFVPTQASLTPPTTLRQLDNLDNDQQREDDNKYLEQVQEPLVLHHQQHSHYCPHHNNPHHRKTTSPSTTVSRQTNPSSNTCCSCSSCRLGHTRDGACCCNCHCRCSCRYSKHRRPKIRSSAKRSATDEQARRLANEDKEFRAPLTDENSSNYHNEHYQQRVLPQNSTNQRRPANKSHALELNQQIGKLQQSPQPQSQRLQADETDPPALCEAPLNRQPVGRTKSRKWRKANKATRRAHYRQRHGRDTTESVSPTADNNKLSSNLTERDSSPPNRPLNTDSQPCSQNNVQRQHAKQNINTKMNSNSRSDSGQQSGDNYNKNSQHKAVIDRHSTAAPTDVKLRPAYNNPSSGSSNNNDSNNRENVQRVTVPPPRFVASNSRATTTGINAKGHGHSGNENFKRTKPVVVAPSRGHNFGRTDSFTATNSTSSPMAGEQRQNRSTGNRQSYDQPDQRDPLSSSKVVSNVHSLEIVGQQARMAISIYDPLPPNSSKDDSSQNAQLPTTNTFGTGTRLQPDRSFDNFSKQQQQQQQFVANDRQAAGSGAAPLPANPRRPDSLFGGSTQQAGRNGDTTRFQQQQRKQRAARHVTDRVIKSPTIPEEEEANFSLINSLAGSTRALALSRVAEVGDGDSVGSASVATSGCDMSLRKTMEKFKGSEPPVESFLVASIETEWGGQSKTLVVEPTIALDTLIDDVLNELIELELERLDSLLDDGDNDQDNDSDNCRDNQVSSEEGHTATGPGETVIKNAFSEQKSASSCSRGSKNNNREAGGGKRRGPLGDKKLLELREAAKKLALLFMSHLEEQRLRLEGVDGKSSLSGAAAAVAAAAAEMSGLPGPESESLQRQPQTMRRGSAETKPVMDALPTKEGSGAAQVDEYERACCTRDGAQKSDPTAMSQDEQVRFFEHSSRGSSALARGCCRANLERKQEDAAAAADCCCCPPTTGAGTVETDDEKASTADTLDRGLNATDKRQKQQQQHYRQQLQRGHANSTPTHVSNRTPAPAAASCHQLGNVSMLHDPKSHIETSPPAETSNGCATKAATSDSDSASDKLVSGDVAGSKRAAETVQSRRGAPHNASSGPLSQSNSTSCLPAQSGALALGSRNYNSFSPSSSRAAESSCGNDSSRCHNLSHSCWPKRTTRHDANAAAAFVSSAARESRQRRESRRNSRDIEPSPSSSSSSQREQQQHKRLVAGACDPGEEGQRGQAEELKERNGGDGGGRGREKAKEEAGDETAKCQSSKPFVSGAATAGPRFTTNGDANRRSGRSFSCATSPPCPRVALATTTTTTAPSIATTSATIISSSQCCEAHRGDDGLVVACNRGLQANGAGVGGPVMSARRSTKGHASGGGGASGDGNSANVCKTIAHRPQSHGASFDSGPTAADESNVAPSAATTTSTTATAVSPPKMLPSASVSASTALATKSPPPSTALVVAAAATGNSKNKGKSNQNKRAQDQGPALANAVSNSSSSNSNSNNSSSGSCSSSNSCMNSDRGDGCVGVMRDEQKNQSAAQVSIVVNSGNQDKSIRPPSVGSTANITTTTRLKHNHNHHQHQQVKNNCETTGNRRDDSGGSGVAASSRPDDAATKKPSDPRQQEQQKQQQANKQNGQVEQEVAGVVVAQAKMIMSYANSVKSNGLAGNGGTGSSSNSGIASAVSRTATNGPVVAASAAASATSQRSQQVSTNNGKALSRPPPPPLVDGTPTVATIGPANNNAGGHNGVPGQRDLTPTQRAPASKSADSSAKLANNDRAEQDKRVATVSRASNETCVNLSPKVAQNDTDSNNNRQGAADCDRLVAGLKRLSPQSIGPNRTLSPSCTRDSGAAAAEAAAQPLSGLVAAKQEQNATGAAVEIKEAVSNGRRGRQTAIKRLEGDGNGNGNGGGAGGLNEDCGPKAGLPAASAATTTAALVAKVMPSSSPLSSLSLNVVVNQGRREQQQDDQFATGPNEPPTMPSRSAPSKPTSNYRTPLPRNRGKKRAISRASDRSVQATANETTQTTERQAAAPSSGEPTGGSRDCGERPPASPRGQQQQQQQQQPMQQQAVAQPKQCLSPTKVGGWLAAVTAGVAARASAAGQLATLASGQGGDGGAISALTNPASVQRESDATATATVNTISSGSKSKDQRQQVRPQVGGLGRQRGGDTTTATTTTTTTTATTAGPDHSPVVSASHSRRLRKRRQRSARSASNGSSSRASGSGGYGGNSSSSFASPTVAVASEAKLANGLASGASSGERAAKDMLGGGESVAAAAAPFIRQLPPVPPPPSSPPSKQGQVSLGAPKAWQASGGGGELSQAAGKGSRPSPSLSSPGASYREAAQLQLLSRFERIQSEQRQQQDGGSDQRQQQRQVSLTLTEAATTTTTTTTAATMMAPNNGSNQTNWRAAALSGNNSVSSWTSGAGGGRRLAAQRCAHKNNRDDIINNDNNSVSLAQQQQQQQQQRQRQQQQVQERQHVAQVLEKEKISSAASQAYSTSSAPASSSLLAASVAQSHLASDSAVAAQPTPVTGATSKGGGSKSNKSSSSSLQVAGKEAQQQPAALDELNAIANSQQQPTAIRPASSATDSIDGATTSTCNANANTSNSDNDGGRAAKVDIILDTNNNNNQNNTCNNNNNNNNDNNCNSLTKNTISNHNNNKDNNNNSNNINNNNNNNCCRRNANDDCKTNYNSCNRNSEQQQKRQEVQQKQQHQKRQQQRQDNKSQAGTKDDSLTHQLRKEKKEKAAASSSASSSSSSATVAAAPSSSFSSSSSSFGPSNSFATNNTSDKNQRQTTTTPKEQTEEKLTHLSNEQQSVQSSSISKQQYTQLDNGQKVPAVNISNEQQILKGPNLSSLLLSSSGVNQIECKNLFQSNRKAHSETNDKNTCCSTTRPLTGSHEEVDSKIRLTTDDSLNVTVGDNHKSEGDISPTHLEKTSDSSNATQCNIVSNSNKKIEYFNNNSNIKFDLSTNQVNEKADSLKLAIDIGTIEATKLVEKRNQEETSEQVAAIASMENKLSDVSDQLTRGDSRSDVVVQTNELPVSSTSHLKKDTTTMVASGNTNCAKEISTHRKVVMTSCDNDPEKNNNLKVYKNEYVINSSLDGSKSDDVDMADMKTKAFGSIEVKTDTNINRGHENVGSNLEMPTNGQQQLTDNHQHPSSLSTNNEQKTEQPEPAITSSTTTTPAIATATAEATTTQQEVPIKIPANNRSILILREIDSNSSESSVRDIFNSENCPSKPVHCEYALHNSWYVTFSDDEDARLALAYIRKHIVKWNGKPIMARYKPKPAVPSAANQPPTHHIVPTMVMQQQQTQVPTQGSADNGANMNGAPAANDRGAPTPTQTTNLTNSAQSSIHNTHAPHHHYHQPPIVMSPGAILNQAARPNGAPAPATSGPAGPPPLTHPSGLMPSYGHPHPHHSHHHPNASMMHHTHHLNNTHHMMVHHHAHPPSHHQHHHAISGYNPYFSQQGPIVPAQWDLSTVFVYNGLSPYNKTSISSVSLIDGNYHRNQHQNQHHQSAQQQHHHHNSYNHHHNAPYLHHNNNSHNHHHNHNHHPNHHSNSTSSAAANTTTTTTTAATAAVTSIHQQQQNVFSAPNHQGTKSSRKNNKQQHK